MTRLLIAAAILVMAAACGTAERAERIDGPVRFGAIRGTVCLPANSSGDFLFGTNVVINTRKAGIDVTSVTMDGAKNLEYIEAFDTPISGNDIFPASTKWPVDMQHFDPLVRLDWERRESAIGPARLAGRTSIGWNFVLHLRTTSSHASLKDFKIHYTSEGQRYAATSGIALIVRPSCSSAR